MSIGATIFPALVWSFFSYIAIYKGIVHGTHDALHDIDDIVERRVSEALKRHGVSEYVDHKPSVTLSASSASSASSALSTSSADVYGQMSDGYQFIVTDAMSRQEAQKVL